MTEAFPLRAFVTGRLPPSGFSHREHIAAAHALLQRHDFAESATIYAKAIRAMAAAAGEPQKFHMTITVAMLSAIAERSAAPAQSFNAFAAANPELFERDFLFRHYSPERLQCDFARTTFLLPDQCGH